MLLEPRRSTLPRSQSLHACTPIRTLTHVHTHTISIHDTRTHSAFASTNNKPQVNTSKNRRETQLHTMSALRARAPCASLRRAAPSTRPALPLRRAAVAVRAEGKHSADSSSKPATAVAEATRRGGAMLAAAVLSSSLLFSAVVPEQALAARSGGRASGSGFSRRAYTGGAA